MPRGNLPTPAAIECADSVPPPSPPNCQLQLPDWNRWEPENVLGTHVRQCWGARGEGPGVMKELKARALQLLRASADAPSATSPRAGAGDDPSTPSSLSKKGTPSNQGAKKRTPGGGTPVTPATVGAFLSLTTWSE